MLPVVCVRPTMPILGQPELFPNPPGPLLEPIAQQFPVMPEAVPLFITDFPLSQISTLYWLATLTRATYSPGGALFTQAARAVVPASYPVTFVANGGGNSPGYGIIKFPQFMVVCISGTTNLNQWLAQIFLNGLVDTSYPLPGGNDVAQTMAIYKTAADTIAGAITIAAGDDRPVLLCGHSMGGAIAMVLHYKYRALTPDRKPSRCVTFAAPKPGDANLISGLRRTAQILRRLTINGDPIPSLPPSLPKAVALVVPAVLQPTVNTWSAYSQGGNLYYVDGDGNQQGGNEPNLPLFVAEYLIQVGMGRGIIPPVEHLMGSYVRRFRRNFGNQLPAVQTSRWTNPAILEQVNDLLSAAFL